MNQKKKGSRRELELAHIFQDKGFKDAHRTQQFCGDTSDNAADVVGLPFIHVECKGTQVTNINAFIKQAKRDAAKKKTKELPTVFYKRNNEPWLVVMDIEDWFKLYNEFLKNRL